MIKDRRNDEKRDSVEDDLTERSVSYAYNNMEAQNRRKRRLETEEDNEGSKKVSAHRRIDVTSLLISWIQNQKLYACRRKYFFDTQNVQLGFW